MSSGGRRFDVSALQVMASVLAAVTGAIAASYLGVAGTIIGTAMMSVAGTAGSAIYRFYLGAGKERLQAKAAELAPKTMDSSLATALNRHRQETEAARALREQEPGGQAGPAAAWARAQAASRGAARADVPQQASGLHDSPTQMFPAVTDDPGGYRQGAGGGDSTHDRRTAAFRDGETAPWSSGAGPAAYRNGNGTAPYAAPGHGAAGYAPGGGYGPDDPQATAAFGTGHPGYGTGAGDLIPGTAGHGDGRGPGGRSGHHSGRPGSRPRWVVIALASLAVFAVTMTGITVFELAVGKPLEAVVYHRKATGTTLGHAVSPGSSRHSARPGPATGHRASHSPAGTPAPSATTPAPGASHSASPTPAGSVSPSVSAPAQGPRSSSPAARAGQ